MTASWEQSAAPKILELGGGANPSPGVTCNVDVRQCYAPDGRPTVSFTADFEKPLPIQSDEWDAVISRYSLEHVSWRRVGDHIREIHRILKPGGMAFVTTANLHRQAQIIVEKEAAGELTDEQVCMVFGDNDYPENTHRAGWSAQTALAAFQEAGFVDVMVRPLPQWAGDMLLEARKGA